MLSFPSAAADFYTIAIYRATPSTSASGVTTYTWATSHSVKRIDVQPVSTELRQQFEGKQSEIRYECIVKGVSADIQNGDRVKDPLASSAPTDPDLEVFDLQKFPARGGLPAYIGFLLRKIGQS